ncbi:hypothetical protein EBR57_02885 [bacterium]|nr:hypothetical protein [bacterium]
MGFLLKPNFTETIVHYSNPSNRDVFKERIIEASISAAIAVKEDPIGPKEISDAQFRLKIVDGNPDTREAVDAICKALRSKQNRIRREILELVDFRSLNIGDKSFGTLNDKVSTLLDFAAEFGIIDTHQPFNIGVLDMTIASLC